MSGTAQGTNKNKATVQINPATNTPSNTITSFWVKNISKSTEYYNMAGRGHLVLKPGQVKEEKGILLGAAAGIRIIKKSTVPASQNPKPIKAAMPKQGA